MNERNDINQDSGEMEDEQLTSGDANISVFEIDDAMENDISGDLEVDAENIDQVENELLVSLNDEPIRTDNSVADTKEFENSLDLDSPNEISEEEIQKLTQELSELESKRNVLHEGRQDLESWIGHRSTSYLSQLVVAFESERDQATKDKERSDQMLASVSIPSAIDLKLATNGFIHKIKMATLYWIAASLGIWILKEVVIRIGQVALGDSVIVQSVVAFLVDWLTGSIFNHALMFFLTGYLLAFVGVFISYYREWTNLSRAFIKAQSIYEYSVRLEEHTYQQSSRLYGLHVYAIKLLKMLATSLRRPYELPDRYTEDPIVDIRNRELPLSVRFGEAKTNSRAQHLRLRREVLRKLVRTSWRSNLFSSLVEKIGNDLGYSKSQFNVERIDKDLSTGNLTVVETLQANLSDQNSLENVGSEWFEKLAKAVKEEVVPIVNLPVVVIHPNPVADLVNPDGEQEINWKNFLGEIFSKDDVSKTPTVSPDILNEIARSRNPINRNFTDSIALIASDFTLLETNLIEDRVDQRLRDAVDITVRADLVGPLDKDNLKLFSSGDSSMAPAKASEIEEKLTALDTEL